MKKFLAGALTGTLVLSLTACLPNINVNVNNGGKDNNTTNATLASDNNNGDDDGDNNVSGNDNNTDNPDSNVSTDNTQDNGEKGTGYESYPVWNSWTGVGGQSFYQDAEGNYKDKVKTEFTEISVKSTEENNFDYAELSESIQKLNDENRKNLEETYEKLLKEWEEEFGNLEEAYLPPEYEIDRKGVVRADQKVFSIMENCEVYYGGAHGGNYVGGVTLDSQTGEKLELSDILKKTDGLAEIITDELYENYDHSIFFAETKDELLETVSQYVDEGLGWTVNYDGVAFYFGDYALAAYASGHQVVYINYSEYPEYLNEEYFEDVPEEYIIPVKNDIYYPMTIDGKELSVCFNWEKTYNSEYDFYSETYQMLNVWGTPYFFQEIDMEGSMMDPGVYIVRKNGKDYLYVSNYYFDGVEFLQIFEYKNGEFKEIGSYHGGIYFDSNEMKDTDFIADGSFAGNFAFSKNAVSIRDDGLLEFSDTYYYDIYENWENSFYYIALSDIEGYEVDGKGKLTSDKVTLKKNTKVTPYSSDKETYLVLMDEDGNYYGFKIKINEYDQTLINGKDSGELFDSGYDY